MLRALDASASTSSGSQRKFAVDVGCGEGRDTIEILRRGYCVLGIDANSDALVRLQERAAMHGFTSQLKTQVLPFESLILPIGIDLINASFSLPFCLPDYFELLWQKIYVALKPGGFFCGQLFGVRDTWAKYQNISCHSREEVAQLLAPFREEFFLEEERHGETALGVPKHWHIFHFVGRKEL